MAQSRRKPASRNPRSPENIGERTTAERRMIMTTADDIRTARAALILEIDKALKPMISPPPNSLGLSQSIADAIDRLIRARQLLGGLDNG